MQFNMVLISKAHRRAAYEYFIYEGVIVGIKNHSIQRRLLKSIEYLNGVLNCQWNYYMLYHTVVKHHSEYICYKNIVTKISIFIN